MERAEPPRERVLHNTDTIKLAGFSWPDVKHGYGPFGYSESHLMLSFLHNSHL